MDHYKFQRIEDWKNKKSFKQRNLDHEIISDSILKK